MSVLSEELELGKQASSCYSDWSMLRRDHRAGWSRSALFRSSRSTTRAFDHPANASAHTGRCGAQLDPFGVHGEQTLRGVMERVGLPVQQFSKPADDLSVGQQQLLALEGCSFALAPIGRRSS